MTKQKLEAYGADVQETNDSYILCSKVSEANPIYLYTLF